MFNFKKHNNNIKISATTPDEFIQENIQAPSEIPFLRDFNADVESLRKLAGELIKMEGGVSASPDIVERVISKLLDRAGSVFIPELERLSGMKKRTVEEVEPLLKYQKPEEVAAIRNFIASEIMARRLEVGNEFNKIFQRGKIFNPDFTLEMMCFIAQNNPKQISENEEITSTLTGEQTGELKNQVNDLAQKVRMMNSNARIWNRILEVHKDIPNREQWASLIPDSLRIEWSLISILKYLNYPMSNVPENKRSRAVSGDRERDERYYFFYPETDDMNRPLVTDEEKRRFALLKLKECVENGYEDEAIFDALGITIKKGKVKKGRPKQTQTPEAEIIEEEAEIETPEDVEVEIDPAPTKAANDSYGAKLRYYLNYIVKPMETTMAFGSKQKLAAFRYDLREAGCSATAELLGRAYEKAEDERYKDFDLKFLSQEEKNICEILRNDYSLDVIPFPVKIPCPSDNPTSTDRFEIDFLLPADVLLGFEEEEILNTNTGSIERIIKPIIEHQIIFIGEYFGIRYTMSKKIEDKGKPWVRPDGSIPRYHYQRTGKTFFAIPGGNCRELEFYKLKTEWKIFTSEVIGDIFGTRTLSFDDGDLDYPRNLMKKLDAQRIIYKHAECDKFKGCLAFNEIMKFATKTPDIDIYLYDEAIKERFNNVKNRSLNIIDCAVVNVKLTEALFRAKQEFVTSEYGGFDRQTMFNHKQILDELKQRAEFLREQLKVKADQKTLNKLNDVLEEIKSFSSSPLIAFKQYLDQILTEGKISKKVAALIELREKIESDQIKPSLFELRSMITNISPEMIGQIEERGTGEE